MFKTNPFSEISESSFFDNYVNNYSTDNNNFMRVQAFVFDKKNHMEKKNYSILLHPYQKLLNQDDLAFISSIERKRTKILDRFLHTMARFFQGKTDRNDILKTYAVHSNDRSLNPDSKIITTDKDKKIIVITESALENSNNFKKIITHIHDNNQLVKVLEKANDTIRNKILEIIKNNDIFSQEQLQKLTETTQNKKVKLALLQAIQTEEPSEKSLKPTG